jgi:hypothetical protein
MLFSIFCNVHGPFLLLFFSPYDVPIGCHGKKTKNIELPIFLKNTGFCHTQNLKETIKHTKLIICYNVELAKHFVKKTAENKWPKNK